jgi:hemerythrin
MRVVNWEDSYSLGISRIDSHHRHLLELLNMAYSAIIELKDINKARYLFHELLAYADYHFSAEEELMKSAGYNGLASHSAEHEKYKSHINEFLDKFLASEEMCDCEVVIFLEEWLINHILLVDKKFAPLVIAKGDLQ